MQLVDAQVNLIDRERGAEHDRHGLRKLHIVSLRPRHAGIIPLCVGASDEQSEKSSRVYAQYAGWKHARSEALVKGPLKGRKTEFSSRVRLVALPRH